MTHRERHAHLSLFHGADATTVGHYIAATIEAERATSFTTTESSAKTRRKAKRALRQGWIVTRSGEYLIGVDRDRYQRTPFFTLSRFSRIHSGSASWRDLFAARRRFVHRATGRDVLFVAAHTPAGVERGDQWRDGDALTERQVEASQAGVTRMGRVLGKAMRKRPELIVILGADTNVDHHRAIWRDRFKAMLGLSSMWTRERPAAGTHAGSRLIDAIYSNAPMTDPRIVRTAKPADVDHRGVAVTLTIKEK